jgi:hypothetical protein
MRTSVPRKCARLAVLGSNKMRLKVETLALEDTWKDIVRIKKEYRKDHLKKHVPRGKVCRISVGERSKWVIVHGREPSDNIIQMDLTTRLALGVDENEFYEFSLERLSWIRSLWFPWKASDPMYRLPAQLSIVSFFLGVVLGVLGIVVGLMPIYLEQRAKKTTSQSTESSAAPSPAAPTPATK